MFVLLNNIKNTFTIIYAVAQHQLLLMNTYLLLKLKEQYYRLFYQPGCIPLNLRLTILFVNFK